MKEGIAATEEHTLEFAGARLAAFKVPRMVVILTARPKGTAGKVQRIGLAQKLGLIGQA